MPNPVHKLQVARDREEGATMVEYGLLVGLIAVVLIAAVVFFSTSMSDALYQKAGNCLSTIAG